MQSTLTKIGCVLSKAVARSLAKKGVEKLEKCGHTMWSSLPIFLNVSMAKSRSFFVS